MIIREYLKDKIVPLVIFFVVMVFTFIFLEAMGMNMYSIVFLMSIYFIAFTVSILNDFLKKYGYYNDIIDKLDKLDKKYLVSEIISKPSFMEGKITYDIAQETCKAMNDHIAGYEIAEKEYKEYIEMWVHEIKTPIATSKIIIENNKDEVTESILEEINKVDNYIEQTLFYARSSNVEKDYIIKELNLESIVKGVIKKNAKNLIQNRIAIELNDLDKTIYSDSKWIEFILNQIVGNSIKYMDKEKKEIRIHAKEENNSVLLRIEDNGIGVSKKDLSKVFEKGYTGESGRRFSKSTGMGLYICKRLCEKMGLNLGIQSEEGRGTVVSIIFPKSNVYMRE